MSVLSGPVDVAVEWCLYVCMSYSKNHVRFNEIFDNMTNMNMQELLYTANLQTIVCDAFH